jgi:hypothetical protein
MLKNVRSKVALKFYGCKIGLKLQHLVLRKNLTADVVHDRKAVQGKDNWYNLL